MEKIKVSFEFDGTMDRTDIDKFIDKYKMG